MTNVEFGKNGTKVVKQNAGKADAFIAEGLPEGSKVLTHEKRTGLLNVFDTLVAFIIWHYPFWGFAYAVIWALCIYVGLISWTTAWIITAVYWLQLLFYNPHYSGGFKYWDLVLFSSVLDSFYYYLGSTIIREGPAPDPKRKIMLAVCPHGMLGICRALCGTAWHKLYPGVYFRWGSFSAAYKIPGIREFSLLVGAVDAGKKTLTMHAEKGESIALLPGGIQEMLLTDGESNITKLCLKGRYGFIKLAKENDMLVVPSFCFGEKWTCRKVLLPFWQTLHKMRLAGAMFFGRWGTLLPAIDRPVGWVMGQAIETRGKEIEDIHAEFLQGLEELFERNKKTFGYSEDEKLEFLEVKKRTESEPPSSSESGKK